MALHMESATAILVYCLCSMSMIFVNKYILSTLNFSFALTLLLLQSVITVLTLKLLQATKIIKLRPFSFKTVQLWAPVTLLFGLMLFTGSKTIIYLSIPILTVFKNLTNLVIAAGDWYFFGQNVSAGILFSFALMTVGSVMSGFTDLEFNLAGYLWMMLNCLAQAGYVLYMKQAGKVTQLTEWEMAFYNNLLSIALMSTGASLTGEFSALGSYTGFNWFPLGSSIVFSGVIGTLLSFSVFWCINMTSPTTYSMVGAMNKIPITFLSVFFFKTLLDFKSGFSICVGLASGVVYVVAKYQSTGLKDAKKDKKEDVKKDKATEGVSPLALEAGKLGEGEE